MFSRMEKQPLDFCGSFDISEAQEANKDQLLSAKLYDKKRKYQHNLESEENNGVSTDLTLSCDFPSEIKRPRISKISSSAEIKKSIPSVVVSTEQNYSMKLGLVLPRQLQKEMMMYPKSPRIQNSEHWPEILRKQVFKNGETTPRFLWFFYIFEAQEANKDQLLLAKLYDKKRKYQHNLDSEEKSGVSTDLTLSCEFPSKIKKPRISEISSSADNKKSILSAIVVSAELKLFDETWIAYASATAKRKEPDDDVSEESSNSELKTLARNTENEIICNPVEERKKEAEASCLDKTGTF
ncbi:hypothetical protein GH714_020428 [Hevea brasiliensis]|uniref:Uncharacterized protein n=1 Tax=Hevea brasiliensis TaxID=3981 RepID=A0A6A6L7A5_HEVBR|nr:hypothetical protein GH714_020428 [Hevea brasiliensis]